MCLQERPHFWRGEKGRKCRHRWVWPGPSNAAGTRQDTGLRSVGQCGHGSPEAGRAAPALSPSAGLHLGNRAESRGSRRATNTASPKPQSREKYNVKPPAKVALKAMGTSGPEEEDRAGNEIRDAGYPNRF